MNIYAPDYYKSFKCIADKCRHSCCIGWEIDIDEETYDYYKSLNDSFGKRIISNIEFSDGTPHFILGENERCPFLNEKKLCDIFSILGENRLCQICSDHPRYRNFFDTYTEIGLGLCCEEACRLILEKESKTTLIKIETDSEPLAEDEEIFFSFRQKIFDILQNRTKTIDERLNNLLDLRGLSLPQKSAKEWYEIFKGLEILDREWTDYLNIICEYDTTATLEDFETAFEQISVYFIFRHLADGFYDCKINTRIKFCVMSVMIIRKICMAYKEKYGSINLENISEITRMYSSEIEYSEENIESLMEILS